MGKTSYHGTILVFSLLVALLMLASPVSAINGTINIAYRGAGGIYIGESIIFDGINTFGNVTLLKMTGPGLPAAGVPLSGVNGAPGSGNVVPVNDDGSWRLVWYTNTIKGVEKLQTSRYYITAFDQTHPDQTYVTAVVLKKPEFYVNVVPNSASPGDYVQLVGTSEAGNSNVRFEIMDGSGSIVRSYDSSVSGSGYFNKGFHVDLPPGQYAVRMSSPAMKTTSTSYLTVNIPVSDSQIPGTSGNTVPATQTPATQVTPPTGMGSLSLSSTPAGASVFLDSAPAGNTPLVLNAVPVGDHVIVMKAPGYVTTSFQITVKPGDMVMMSPTMQKNPSSIPLSTLTVIAGLLISFAILAGAVKTRKD